jgi:hypothetical protein
MPVSGSQDFWVVGSRAYFKKAGTNPWRDLGIIQTVTPNITTESIELEDPDGGVKTTSDKQVTKVTENYDLTLSNLSLRNLSMLFLGADPTTISVSAAEVSKVSTDTFVGELFQIVDSASEPVRMTKIAGVQTGATTEANDITAIDVSTKTITVTTDFSAVASMANGKQFIIHPEGLADKANAGTYTVSGTPTATTVTVTETFGGADETAVTVDLTHAGASGTVYDQGTDWSTVNDDRGVFKWIDGGAMSVAATSVTVVYWQYAITGLRQVLPQAVTTIEGELRVIFSRDTFALETERYIPKVKVTPGSTNFQVDDYSSFVMNFEVVADDSLTNTVGHLKQYKGTLPAIS